MEYFWITSPERGFIKLADELLPELLLSWLSTTFAAVFWDGNMQPLYTEE